MHVLVTGGAGFIGSALVDRLLAEGHRVDVVDNLSSGSLGNLADARRVAGGALSFHQLDVRSPDVAELISLRRPEVVWHLAAQTSPPQNLDDVAVDAEVSVVGTLRLVAAATGAGCRKIVVTSSAASVYAEPAPDQLPIPEHHPRQPRAAQGIAKHAVDSYLMTLRQPQGVEFTSLVLGTVYGPRDGHGVVGSWARALVAGQPWTVFGDGSQTRDFVFVDDVVDGLARAADRGDGLVLNLGTGVETSLTALHGMLVAAAASSVSPSPPASPASPASLASAPVRQPARPGEMRRCSLDVSRAGIYLDWRPWTGLAQGLGAVIEAERARPAVPGASSEPHDTESP